MGKDAGLFQVAVGEVSSRDVDGHYASLDVWREGGAPKSGRMARSEEDPPPPHAQLGSIH